jgi:hypothetical protein
MLTSPAATVPARDRRRSAAPYERDWGEDAVCTGVASGDCGAPLGVPDFAPNRRRGKRGNELGNELHSPVRVKFTFHGVVESGSETFEKGDQLLLFGSGQAPESPLDCLASPP